MNCFVTTLRVLIVLLFLVGMPVLAMPQVADWCEAQLYGVVPPSRQPAPPSFVIGQSTPLPFVPLQEFALLEPTVPTPEATTLPVAAEPEPDLDALVAEVRALGATFYRLDQIQQTPPLYRFTAQFAQDGDVPRRWQHAATHNSPTLAIRQLIAEIANR